MKKPFKILIVNTRHFYGGGDSTYSFNLADLLSSHGHETAFFAMKDTRNLSDPNDDLFTSAIDFRDLNQHKNVRNGVKVFSRTIYSAEARHNFARLLDRFSPDIIHLQNFLGHLTISILYEARLRGLPVVWTLHDYYLACPNAHFLIDRTGEICEACRGQYFYKAISTRCKKDSLLASAMAALVAYCNRWMGILNKIDAYLTPSDFLRNKMLPIGLNEDKVHHVPLFIPRNKFWDGENNQGYFLFLGKLEAIKGIEILIEAARRVNDVKLLIAGSIDETQADRLLDRLPMNAKYIGMKHGQELIDLIHNAFTVVLPSIWYENQPFSILEAFAAGKPVIASDLGGMTELVSHKERGLLIKPADPQPLAEAFQWAFTNQKLMMEMGKNAREYALQNHSQEVHYQSLMSIYNQVYYRNIS
jgi:glycosyltransferase involved in cell wall biosynthesis